MERRGAAQLPARDVSTPVMRALAGHRGSSFVELLTSTLLVCILSAMSYGFARAALRSARVQEAKSETQEVAALALDVLSHELRMAGFSAAGQPLVGVRAAGPERVQVVADLNGDGDTADSNEVVTYTYDGDKRQLMRATSDGSPQPFARHVPAGGVRFSFYDATGAEIPAESMTLADRQRIHRIDTTLVLELPGPDQESTQPLRTSATSTVYLRNQLGGTRE
jgi:hypothetical protein